MKAIKSVALLFGILIGSLSVSSGQTNLEFTGVSATVEQAILLHWASQSNHIYQVQYANALGTNANGALLGRCFTISIPLKAPIHSLAIMETTM